MLFQFALFASLLTQVCIRSKHCPPPQFNPRCWISCFYFSFFYSWSCQRKFQEMMKNMSIYEKWSSGKFDNFLTDFSSILFGLETCRLLGYERVYLTLFKVADTPFHIYVFFYSIAGKPEKCDNYCENYLPKSFGIQIDVYFTVWICLVKKL